MNQYYESEVLFHLMERDGLNIPSSVPPYEAEIKAYLINQVKQAYPKLTDYEAEWLLYNYTKHLPAEFPVNSVTDVTEATFENVVPFAYQSAILKGNTLLVDELGNECEIPNTPKITMGAWIYTNNGDEATSATSFNTGFLKCPTVPFIVKGNNKYKRIVFYNKNKTFISGIDTRVSDNSDITISSTQIPSNAFYLRMSASISTDGVSYTPDTKLLIEDVSGNNLYITQLVSVKMPVLTTSNGDGTKTNILTVNEGVTLRSNGSVCDELDLLTGKLTQRIDEDGEILTQEVVKTVELTTVNEKGETTHFMPFEGTMHALTSSETIQPTFDMTVPIEATTQNLASFIDLEMRNNNE